MILRNSRQFYLSVGLFAVIGLCMFVLYQEGIKPANRLVYKTLDTSYHRNSPRNANGNSDSHASWKSLKNIETRKHIDLPYVSSKSSEKKEMRNNVDSPYASWESPENRPIRQQRNASFNYRAAMMQLNKLRVHQDDPRLIELIRNYYLVPPSTQPYNLQHPDRMDHSRGQTPFVDSRLNSMVGGFYVEAGALDGERGSTSLFFERVRKWNGLLVEADPATFAALMTKHRKAYIINACLSTNTFPSMVTFNKAYELGRVVHGEEVKKWIRQQGLRTNEVTVQCFPLYSILLALKQLTIDFFSLDVEGDELGVLQTLPMDKVTMKMLTVEFIHGKGGVKGLTSYMNNKGFDNMLYISRWDYLVNDIVFRNKSIAEFY